MMSSCGPFTIMPPIGLVMFVVVLAVVLLSVAMAIFFGFTGLNQRLIGAIVIGGAVAVVHYTVKPT